MDGTPYTYQNWSVTINEPESDELCAVITRFRDGKWQGEICSVPVANFKFPYICEKGMFRM